MFEKVKDFFSGVNLAGAAAPKKSIEEIAREVLSGLWGSGDARKEKLIKAGYDYNKVQARVNEIVEIQNAFEKAAIAQVEWSKDSIYKWESKPTIEKSKTKGTCVTFVACTLQRMGILKPGEFVWHNGGGFGKGKVTGATKDMTVTYYNNKKTLKDLKSVIQKGDLLLFDDNQSGKAGSGGHICIFNGKTSDTKFYTYTGGHTISANRGESAKRKVLAIVRINNIPKKKSIDEIAKEVLDGKWGSGKTRKERLIAAGYNYEAVQKRVTEIIAEREKKKEKGQYKGQLPTLRLTKTNAEVIEDTIKWAKWIAGDNRFHYGKGKEAHHNGCYFCGTQPKVKKVLLDWELTYCCNPFVGAAWAHGGCVPTALNKCSKCGSWDFHTGVGYDASKLFTKLGHPKKSELKAGDVLCRDTHVALYIGNGKIVEAGGEDDNIRNSAKWNNSIRVKDLTDSNYKNFPRAYRFNSIVDADIIMRHGEVSKRVEQWQKFLDWYFDGAFSKECGAADGYFGDNTLKWTKKFQEKEIGKGQGDGLCGNKTFEAAKKVKK